jgi:Toprim-like/DnaB-like helicase C terminal domain
MAEFKYHIKCDKCGSSDGKAVYSDSSTFCWVCKNATLSDEYKEALKENTKVKQFKQIKKENMQFKDESPKNVKPVIDPDVAKQIKSSTSNSGNGFRSIKDETYTYFGVRHAFNEETGEVQEQYYPCTQDGQLTGYKIREVPKNFRSIARTGADCELFGQFRFNRGGKYVLLVEGELDALSAYQMLKDYAKSKNSDFETAVVSPTTGANSKKQVQAQYKFFDTFDNIILAYDNDKAGKEAAEDILKYLPKGKVKVLQMRHKDPNEYLMADDNKNFIQDFYNARVQMPVGVLASTDIYQKMLNTSNQEKITLPPAFSKLNAMLGGGLTLGHAYTCSGVTGGGKTALSNEMIYHWIFNSPYTVGVVSLELNAAQYGEVLLSRHLQNKIAKLNPEEKSKFLRSDKVVAASKELFEKEDGSPRFMLVEDRDSTFEQFQEVVEQMVISAGVQLIVIDPWTDIGIDGLSIDEQAVAMKWIKSMIKSHNCTFFLINHVRKGQSGQKDQSSGGMITESDIMGSSSVMKSASANILLVRNKLAEDALERNSTRLYLSKNRLLSDTGPAGTIYYDSDTHTLHDLDTWLNDNGMVVF